MVPIAPTMTVQPVWTVSVPSVASTETPLTEKGVLMGSVCPTPQVCRQVCEANLADKGTTAFAG